MAFRLLAVPKAVLALLIVLSFGVSCLAQVQTQDTSLDRVDSLAQQEYGPVGNFLTPATEFHPRRFWIGVGAATTIYTGFAIGLWEAWYKDYPTGKFRTFNDNGEWLDMDKLGHAYTAYHYTRWGYQGLRWAGASRNKALLLGAGTSTLLQTTVEVMDGFSQQWGFSWTDVAMNGTGVVVFAAQELAWEEQRINVKLSSYNPGYSTAPVPARREGGATSTLAYRGRELYGDTPWERFIKDYNGQTIWLTANPAVLLGKQAKLPWLNVAAGYSVRNVFGAYGNIWRVGNETYTVNELAPRQREYILSLDVDFERIPAKHPVLKTALHLLNHIKFPAPALLLAEKDGLEWRWLYY